MDELARLDEKLYQKALETINKELRTHLMLKFSITDEGITINQLVFKDKRAFMHMMRCMKDMTSTLRKVTFKDIVTLKKNIFFAIC